MIYSHDETERRKNTRIRRPWIRSFKRIIAIFPKECNCCKREFQFEPGWKHTYKGPLFNVDFYYCRECAPTREGASIVHDKCEPLAYVRERWNY